MQLNPEGKKTVTSRRLSRVELVLLHADQSTEPHGERIDLTECDTDQHTSAHMTVLSNHARRENSDIHTTAPVAVTTHASSAPKSTNLHQPEAAVMATLSNKTPLPTWKLVLKKPAVQGTLGLLLGIGLIVAIARFVDFRAAFQQVQQNVATPGGLLLVLLASAAFFIPFCIRALRWKLFLDPVGKVKTLHVITLFLTGVFLNFVLPIRAGELVKCLLLRRNRIPIHRSLPTITMDKVMDLLPALFIGLIIPFLGVHLDAKFWVVLGITNTGLFSVILFVVLTAWKRAWVVNWLERIAALAPGAIGKKISDFAIGFVDALLLSARNPKRLLLSILLTGIAVFCDGLYNYFAFRTIGYPITIGQAILGYMIFNIFYILPAPPGQVGSNEVVGLLIFTGLLHVPVEKVTAMLVFFHLWTGLLMCGVGLTCLSTLGLKFSHMVKAQMPDEASIH
jgi:uncharacterized protein (TIRG00374 family)